MSRRGTARVMMLLVALCGVGAATADDKAIDDVDAGPFSFGVMALGQAKDVDYARAEGLGLVPASPLDTYLNGVLAKRIVGTSWRIDRTGGIGRVGGRVPDRAMTLLSRGARR